MVVHAQHIPPSISIGEYIDAICATSLMAKMIDLIFNCRLTNDIPQIFEIPCQAIHDL